MKAWGHRHISNPFPGLRPFRRDEEYLFFGRESQVDAMVDKLAETGFLAVVGPSGSGKSSLVNCGLEPALRRGLIAKVGTAWRVAHMRPGVDPIGHLAEALADSGILFADFDPGRLTASEIIETTLRMSRLGLIDTVNQARLPKNVNLLIVVDQFEELFRYSKLVLAEHDSDSEVTEDAIAFVNLLLEAKDQPDLPIYVVLTMRSDFLGDCAKFAGLPEAINAGQYLVPRMKRDERRAAITGPVHVGGAEITPVLLTRLVNDVSDNPDQLSVLQHALNRTWADWENRCNREGPLDLKHYQAIGTMASALDAHAERAYGELETEAQKRICEKIFKALTDKATDPRGTRRPTRFDTLCKLVGAKVAEVTAVIDVFRKPSRSFLMPPAGEALEPNKVIDISHESLMRGWQRLRGWAGEEAESAKTYARLAEAAEFYARGKASLWRDPELQLAVAWKERENPTADWAKQYGHDFGQAVGFLQASHRRHKTVEWVKGLSVFAVVMALALGYWLWRDTVESKNARIFAEETAEAVDALHEADRAITQATSGDPIEGSLIALRKLAKISSRKNSDLLQDALLRLESALWQTHARTQLRKILKGHDQEIRSIAFNRHGTLLATGSYDGKALVYDTSTWELVKVIDEDAGIDDKNPSRVLSVQFSPDGDVLATGSTAYPAAGGRKGRVKLWDAVSGNKIRELTESDEMPFAHSGPVRTIAFSPGGEQIITSSYDDTARIWRARDGKLLATLEGHQVDGAGVDVYDAAFNPRDSSVAATGGNDGHVRIWDLARGNNTHFALAGHKQRIKSVAFSPDGKLILSASDDDTVRFWDAENRVQVGKPLEAHWADIWRAIFDAEGKRFFTASWDRSIGVWNAETFNLLARLRGHDGPIRTLDYNLFRQWLASGSTDLTARIWGLEPDDIQYRLASHEDDVTVVRVNPADASVFATGSADGTIRIWKFGARAPNQILEDAKQSCALLNWVPQCAVENIAYSHDGSRLAARYADRTIKIWDPNAGMQVGVSIEAKPGTSSALVALAGLGLLAVNTNPDKISFYDLTYGKVADRTAIDIIASLLAAGHSLEAWSSRVSSMTYSAQRDLLAVGLNGGIVLIWNVKTGEALRPVEILKGPISSVRFNAEGTRLFIASWNTWAIETWDMAEQRMVSEMRGHEGAINDLAVIDGGRRLISTGDDETLKIWDTARGQEIVSLPGHSGTVRSIDVMPARGILISAAEDDTVLVRRIFSNLNELIGEVCTALESKSLADGKYLEEGESVKSLCLTIRSGFEVTRSIRP